MNQTSKTIVNSLPEQGSDIVIRIEQWLNKLNTPINNKAENSAITDLPEEDTATILLLKEFGYHFTQTAAFNMLHKNLTKWLKLRLNPQQATSN